MKSSYSTTKHDSARSFFAKVVFTVPFAQNLETFELEIVQCGLRDDELRAHVRDNIPPDTFSLQDIIAHVNVYDQLRIILILFDIPTPNVSARRALIFQRMLYALCDRNDRKTIFPVQVNSKRDENRQFEARIQWTNRAFTPEKFDPDHFINILGIYEITSGQIFKRHRGNIFSGGERNQTCATDHWAVVNAIRLNGNKRPSNSLLYHENINCDPKVCLETASGRPNGYYVRGSKYLGDLADDIEDALTQFVTASRVQLATEEFKPEIFCLAFSVHTLTFYKSISTSLLSRDEVRAILRNNFMSNTNNAEVGMELDLLHI